MHNMDMESVFRGIIADLQREMKEGEYLPVPCEDDERPPLGFKTGAMAISKSAPMCWRPSPAREWSPWKARRIRPCTPTC